MYAGSLIFRYSSSLRRFRLLFFSYLGHHQCIRLSKDKDPEQIIYYCCSDERVYLV